MDVVRPNIFFNFLIFSVLGQLVCYNLTIMEEIKGILERILRVLQIFIALGGILSLIYLGVLTYFKKIEDVKRNLPLILIGFALLFSTYSIPVLILSFLGKLEVEKPKEFTQSLHPSINIQTKEENVIVTPGFPVGRIISTDEEEYIRVGREEQQIPEQQPEQQQEQYSQKGNLVDYKKLCQNKNLIGIKGLSEKDVDKIFHDYATPYIINKNGTEIIICVVGRDIVRNQFYGPGGELHYQLDLMADRLYKIKKKVPLIKNQPYWFTTIFILDRFFVYNNKKVFNEACDNAKGFFTSNPQRSVFYYCYSGRDEEKSKTFYLEGPYGEILSMSRKEYINNVIAHEAAHALDLRAGMKERWGSSEYLSLLKDKDVYKFINTLDNNTLKNIALYMFDKFCPKKKIDLIYLFAPEKFIEVYKKAGFLENIKTEFFADLLTPFLACDEAYELPTDPRLKKYLEEFIRIIKKYEFIY